MGWAPSGASRRECHEAGAADAPRAERRRVRRSGEECPPMTRVKLTTQVLSALTAVGLAMAILARPAGARDVFTYRDGWRFLRQDVPAAAQEDFDDRAWESVRLPHSYGWEEALRGKNYYRGPGWYRLSFDAPRAGPGRRAFLWFGAASSVADVYLNGQHLGQHRGGFSAFCFEATPAIRFGGSNVLAV